MSKTVLDNEDLQRKSNLLFETLRQHQKILESNYYPEIKINLLSSNFGQLSNRIKDFCDSIMIYSKELECIVRETYRSHDIFTAP
jgi:hypothetical protein